MEDTFFRGGIGSLFLATHLGEWARRTGVSGGHRRARIEAAARDLFRQHDQARPRPASTDVRAYASLLIATYRDLVSEGVSREDALAHLRDVQTRAFAFVTAKTRAALDAAHDAFASMRAVCIERERLFFGEAFTFERPVDDDRAYHLDVTGCEFVRMARAESVPELGPLFCAFDLAWIEAIHPRRHRLAFRRPTTIAEGADRCRFHFERAEAPHG